MLSRPAARISLLRAPARATVLTGRKKLGLLKSRAVSSHCCVSCNQFGVVLLRPLCACCQKWKRKGGQDALPFGQRSNPFRRADKPMNNARGVLIKPHDGSVGTYAGRIRQS